MISGKRQPLLSSPGCRVGHIGKLVNNAGEGGKEGKKCVPLVGGGGFLDAAGSAHEKKDSSAKNTLKVSLSSQRGLEEDDSEATHIYLDKTSTPSIKKLSL